MVTIAVDLGRKATKQTNKQNFPAKFIEHIAFKQVMSTTVAQRTVYDIFSNRDGDLESCNRFSV